MEHLLITLLGEGYAREEHKYDYMPQTEYNSADESKPYRTIIIMDDTGELWYFDSMVTGERGGEYQPPKMRQLPSESLIYCKTLLEGVVPGEWIAHPGMVRRIEERWSNANRWMTDVEYGDYMRNMDAHHFVFEHRTDDNISILGDRLEASVGVNGLSTLDVNWHEFTTDAVAKITPMPLNEAIAIANTTRMSKTVLLYAELVYSNWLTQNDNFNLSWHLVTSKGNYVVDCVLKTHACDSYEY